MGAEPDFVANVFVPEHYTAGLQAAVHLQLHPAIKTSIETIRNI